MSDIRPAGLCAAAYAYKLPCYRPLTGWQNPEVLTETGKKKILFFKTAGPYPGMVEEKIPCGQCRGCRARRALEWTIRGSHEAALHVSNCFITLTFNDENLSRTGTLVKSDFQNFLKRLRKHYFGNTKSNFRYIHCGEYGEDLDRPHHHAILFNFDFPDKIPWNKGLFRSPTLERIWSKQITKSEVRKHKTENIFREHGKIYAKLGYSSIGPANYDTIAYVARYVLKKINGKAAPDHYNGRLPEYASYSNRPAIARTWYEKYKLTDVFPRDFIALRGKRLPVPKYYSKCYELTNPADYGTIRDMRITKAKLNPNNHPDRLKAAEQIQLAYEKTSKRSYERSK